MLGWMRSSCRRALSTSEHSTMHTPCTICASMTIALEDHKSSDYPEPNE